LTNGPRKITRLINPTGSYKLVGKTTIKHGDKYGYFGELKVKLLNDSKISTL
jgi:hypothetical protein